MSLKGLSSEQNIMLLFFNQLVLDIYLDSPRLNYRKLCSEGEEKGIWEKKMQNTHN